MKKTFKYSLLTLASTLIMAGCSKDDNEEQLLPTDIKLSSLNDFKSNMNKAKDDSRTYKAFVSQDIGTDSLGLAQTLTEWKQMDDARSNLTTNWNGKGIYADQAGTAFTMADYKSAGTPKITANPVSGIMPFAASVQDSIDFKKMGVTLKVRRADKVVAAATVDDLEDIIDGLEDEGKPVTVTIEGTINVDNTDSGSLEAVLDKIISNPNISIDGDIKIAASTDSVAVNTGFIEKLQAAGGKITSNGENAMFVDKIENPEKIRAVLDNGVRVRTSVSENFANTDIAIPNKIVYRTSKLKTRSGANDEVDFSTGIKALPTRGTTWKSQNYLLDTGDSELEIRDETALGRISQPAVRGTKEFPNPDIYTEENPKYGTIFLDNTQMWSDSTNVAIAQRVRGAGGKTKVRFSDAFYFANTNAHGKISHSHSAENLITYKIPGGQDQENLILLHINANNIPYGYPIFAEHDDLEVGPYMLDATKYCFVLPAGFELQEYDGQDPFIEIENDRKVLDYITQKTSYIGFTNRFLNDAQVGTLPERKSIFWITAEEYAKYIAQGKRAR